MCLGASECLKCVRWLQPLLLTSKEVRQTAAILWSSVGPRKHSKQWNKSKWEGREPCLWGFAGHLQLRHCSLCLSAWSWAGTVLSGQGCCCVSCAQ